MNVHEFLKILKQRGQFTLRQAIPGRGKMPTELRKQLAKDLSNAGVSHISGVYYHQE